MDACETSRNQEELILLGLTDTICFSLFLPQDRILNSLRTADHSDYRETLGFLEGRVTWLVLPMSLCNIPYKLKNSWALVQKTSYDLPASTTTYLSTNPPYLHLWRARLTPSISTTSLVSRNPAVSLSTTGKPPMFSAASTTSRVVPAIGETIATGF